MTNYIQPMGTIYCSWLAKFIEVKPSESYKANCLGCHGLFQRSNPSGSDIPAEALDVDPASAC